MTKAALAFALLLAATASQAQVFKCPQPGGGMSYQSTPCAVAGAKPASHPTAAQLNAQRASAPQVAAAADAGDPYAADGMRRRNCMIALQNQMVLKRTGAGTGKRAVVTDSKGNTSPVDPYDHARLIDEQDKLAQARCD